MKITLNTKHSIGDIIKIKEKRSFSETCEICDGKKKVAIKDKTFECPNCYGQGSLIKYKTIEEEVKIHKMEIEFCQDHSNNDKIEAYCKYTFIGGEDGQGEIMERIEL